MLRRIAWRAVRSTKISHTLAIMCRTRALSSVATTGGAASTGTRHAAFAGSLSSGESGAAAAATAAGGSSGRAGIPREADWQSEFQSLLSDLRMEVRHVSRGWHTRHEPAVWFDDPTGIHASLPTRQWHTEKVKQTWTRQSASRFTERPQPTPTPEEAEVFKRMRTVFYRQITKRTAADWVWALSKCPPDLVEQWITDWAYLYIASIKAHATPPAQPPPPPAAAETDATATNAAAAASAAAALHFSESKLCPDGRWLVPAPTEAAFDLALSRVSGIHSRRVSRAIVLLIPQCGLQASVRAMNRVLTACADSNNVSGARDWWDGWRELHARGFAPPKNSFAYCTLMRLYDRNDEFEHLLGVWQEIVAATSDTTAAPPLPPTASRRSERQTPHNMYLEADDTSPVAPDAKMMYFIVNAFGKRGDIRRMEQVFGSLLASGVRPSTHVYSAMMSAFHTSFDPAAVVRAFEHMVTLGVHRNVPVYNKLLVSLSYHTHTVDDVRTVVRYYNRMIRDRLRPDIHTFTLMLLAFSRTGDYRGVLRCLNLMRVAGIGADSFVFSSIVDGFARNGHLECVEDTFHVMHEIGIEPIRIMYLSAINGCLVAGDIPRLLYFSDRLRAAVFAPPPPPPSGTAADDAPKTKTRKWHEAAKLRAANNTAELVDPRTLRAILRSLQSVPDTHHPAMIDIRLEATRLLSITRLREPIINRQRFDIPTHDVYLNGDAPEADAHADPNANAASSSGEGSKYPSRSLAASATRAPPALKASPFVVQQILQLAHRARVVFPYTPTRLANSPLADALAPTAATEFDSPPTDISAATAPAAAASAVAAAL